MKKTAALLLTVLLCIGSAVEASPMTNSYPMTIRLQIHPTTCVVTATLQNQGHNHFALRSVISFGTRSGVDTLWLETNAPEIAAPKSLPTGQVEHYTGVHIVKPGETVILGTMDLKKFFVLKPGTYTITGYYQDKRKLRLQETLSAFWTVSDMQEPVVSPPLTFQIR